MSNGTSETPSAAVVTRRAFIGQLTAVTGAGAALCAVPRFAHAKLTQATLATVPAVHRTPVVSFYMDRPYLDMTGAAEPYIPPAGTRSGQALAELSDAEFLSRHPYF